MHLKKPFLPVRCVVERRWYYTQHGRGGTSSRDILLHRLCGGAQQPISNHLIDEYLGY